MAVGFGFTACKYMTVTTICLNKAVSCVLDLYLFIVMITFIYSFTHLFMFPVVVSK